MVAKQSDLHQNEPGYGSAFPFLAVLYGFNSLAFCGLLSAAVDNSGLKGL